MRTMNFLIAASAILALTFAAGGCGDSVTPQDGNNGVELNSVTFYNEIPDSLSFRSGNGPCGSVDSLVHFTEADSFHAKLALIAGGSDSAACACDQVYVSFEALPVTTWNTSDSAAVFWIHFDLPENFMNVVMTLYAVADDGAKVSVNDHEVGIVNFFDYTMAPFAAFMTISGDSLFEVGSNDLSFLLVNTGNGSYGPPAARADSADCYYLAFSARIDYVVAEPCPVEIDIKPGSSINPVNCKKMNGVIPVAILTTDCFDAMQVDHTTVVFGPNEAHETHFNKHGMIRHVEDVDGDGDMDLVFHFRGYETGIMCGDEMVILKGKTFDGREFEASDHIRTVPYDMPDSSCCYED